MSYQFKIKKNGEKAKMRQKMIHEAKKTFDTWHDNDDHNEHHTIEERIVKSTMSGK